MLKDKINEEIKNAMKSGDKVRLETLRSIRASIIEFDKSGAGHEMTEDDEIKILNSHLKKRKDAIEVYQKAGRADLLEKEQAELAIIQEFLPKQLSEEEIVDYLKKLISENNAKSEADFGRLMGPAMKYLKGKADGKFVQETLKSLLKNQ